MVSAVYPIPVRRHSRDSRMHRVTNCGPNLRRRVSAPRFGWLLLGVQLSLACSTRVDPTVLLDGDGAAGGGAPPVVGDSHCEELVLPGRIFLACSTPDVSFADAARDCQRQGGALARIGSAEDNAALLAQVRNSVTHSNLWLGGMRGDDHVWRWPDGSVFWTGLADGTAPPGVFVNWQSGEPNNMSTVTDDPERCAAIALFDGGWRDRACSLSLSYFCELAFPRP